MFEKFTNHARKVMALANQTAQRYYHENIGPEHILLGITKEKSGVGAKALINLGINLEKLQIWIDKLLKSGTYSYTLGKLPQTPRAKKVIEFAIEEACRLKHNYVGTEHMLLGIANDDSEIIIKIFKTLSINSNIIRKAILKVLSKKNDN